LDKTPNFLGGFVFAGRMMSESSNLVAGASSSVDSEVEVSAGEEQVVVVTLKQNKWVVTVMLALNLANSTLGAGVLGLPLVAKDSGLVAAILMLIGCALLTDWTLHLLLQCHLISQLNTYEAIGEFCFGRKGKWAVAVGVMLINFGAMIAYLVIAGDLVAPLIPVDSIRYGVIVLATAIAFPLSLVRGRVLAMVSAASVLLVIGFCFMVVVQAAEGPVHPEEPLVLVQWSTRLVFSFGIVSFAYSCHTNLVPLSAECHGQEVRNSLGSCFLCFFLFVFFLLASTSWRFSSCRNDVVHESLHCGVRVWLQLFAGRNDRQLSRVLSFL
jgi:amino acid permease